MLIPTVYHPSAILVPISTLKIMCKYLKNMLAIKGRKYSTLKSGRDFRLNAKRVSEPFSEHQVSQHNTKCYMHSKPKLQHVYPI